MTVTSYTTGTLKIFPVQQRINPPSSSMSRHYYAVLLRRTLKFGDAEGPQAHTSCLLRSGAETASAVRAVLLMIIPSHTQMILRDSGLFLPLVKVHVLQVSEEKSECSQSPVKQPLLFSLPFPPSILHTRAQSPPPWPFPCIDCPVLPYSHQGHAGFHLFLESNGQSSKALLKTKLFGAYLS